MTPTLTATLSRMKKVSKKDFDTYFKDCGGRFINKKIYYTDDNNRIYYHKKRGGKDVAVYLYEENEYYILKGE